MGQIIKTDVQRYTDHDTQKHVVVGVIGKEEDLLKESLTWYPSSQVESFNSEIINRLSAQLIDIEMLLFIGTWCSDTHEQLPTFLSLLQQLSFSNYRILGVDMEKKMPGKWTEIYQIEHVPTFIILKSGKEIGRIVEQPQWTLEKDLEFIIQNSIHK